MFKIPWANDDRVELTARPADDFDRAGEAMHVADTLRKQGSEHVVRIYQSARKQLADLAVRGRFPEAEELLGELDHEADTIWRASQNAARRMERMALESAFADSIRKGGDGHDQDSRDRATAPMKPDDYELAADDGDGLTIEEEQGHDETP